MAPYFGRQVSTKWSPSGAVDYCGAPPEYDVTVMTSRGREGTQEESLDEGLDHKDFELFSAGGEEEAEYADLDDVDGVKDEVKVKL